MCGLMAVGLGMMAASTIMTGVQKKKQADFQAKMYRRDAEAERAAGELAGADAERQMQRYVGEQMTRYGASGLAGDVGSPVSVGVSTAEEFGRQAYNDDFNRTRRIAGLKGNASSANIAGNNAVVGSVLDTGSQVFNYGMSKTGKVK